MEQSYPFSFSASGLGAVLGHLEWWSLAHLYLFSAQAWFAGMVCGFGSGLAHVEYCPNAYALANVEEY